MNIKEKLYKLKEKILRYDQFHENQKEDELENHSIDESLDIYRLRYINYHHIGERYGMKERVGKIDWMSIPFRMPENITSEDGFKLISYLNDLVEREGNFRFCSLTSVQELDHILDSSSLGFQRMEKSPAIDLFTVDGRISYFKKNPDYGKYFEWYTPNVTREQVEEIYKNAGLEYIEPNLSKITFKKLKPVVEKGEEIPVDLDDKVEDFMVWCFKNKNKYFDIDLVRIRNLIEKIAVWYELRYPDYEISNLFEMGENSKKINKTMFSENPYVKNFNPKAFDHMKWSEFYNKDAFINSLPDDEMSLIQKKEYPEIVYLDSRKRIAHFHLNSDGIIEEAEEFSSTTHGKVSDNELEGLSLKDAILLLKERGVELPINNELEQVLQRDELFNTVRDGILDSAMYRILKRGGNKIGPRRAFLYAKAFDRNVNIPVKYSGDLEDSSLGSFINMYLFTGGNEQLPCYVNYYFRKNKRDKCYLMTIQELLEKQNEKKDADSSVLVKK